MHVGSDYQRLWSAPQARIPSEFAYRSVEGINRVLSSSLEFPSSEQNRRLMAVVVDGYLEVVVDEFGDDTARERAAEVSFDRV